MFDHNFRGTKEQIINKNQQLMLTPKITNQLKMMNEGGKSFKVHSMNVGDYESVDEKETF
jgi:hypothetical protein